MSPETTNQNVVDEGQQMDCHEQQDISTISPDTSYQEVVDEHPQIHCNKEEDTSNQKVVDEHPQIHCNKEEDTSNQKVVDEHPQIHCNKEEDTSNQKVVDECPEMEFHEEQDISTMPPETRDQNNVDERPQNSYNEEDDNSAIPPQKCHDQFDSLTLCFDPEEWDAIKPIEGLPGVQRHLSGEWTERISEKLRGHLPGCVFTFKYNRVKAVNSRKVNAPYFKGKAFCQGPSCSAKIDFTIHKEPFPGDPVNVQCFVDGNVSHFKDEIIKRQVKGLKRQQVAAAASKVGAVNYYYDALGSAPLEELESGNITSCQTPSVLRKIISEAVAKQHLHSNVVTELELLKEAFQSEDMSNTSDMTGYIKDIGTDPFCVIMICPEQIQLARSLSQNRTLNVYIDATGSVISTIPKQKKPYLYSVVVRPDEDVPPVSIADMLSTQHTIPRIEYFLSSMKREVEQGGRQLHVQKIETDYSWALIQSALKTFNLMNIKQCLLAAFNVVYGKKDKSFIEDFTVLHLCTGHMMHDICRKLKSVGGLTARKKLRTFVLQCFARLQNCVIMSEATSIFKLMCTVLGTPETTDDMTNALKTLKKKIQCCEEEVEDELMQENQPERIEQDDELLSFEGKTIKDISPFTSVFLEVFKASNTSNDKEDGSNSFYYPEFLLLLCEKFFPIFPLWSGILLEPSRYFDKTKQASKSRDSNAPVEGWFKALKKDSDIKKHKRPARFVIALRRTLKGRLREIKFPSIRKKKQKKDSGISLTQTKEKWGNNRKSGKDRRQPVYHSMPKQRTCQPSLPVVPTWGGQVEGAYMVNTCTIDNGLTTIYMAYREDSQLKQALKDGIFAVVDCCCRLMMKEEFAEAKALWLEGTGVHLKKTTNVHGDEYDLFVRFINNSLTTKLVSRCSNLSCPEPHHEQKEERGINVRQLEPAETPSQTASHKTQNYRSSLKKPDAVVVDRLLDDWDHYTTDCTAEDVDLVDGRRKTSKFVTYKCPGRRIYKRVLVGDMPPILCVRVFDLVTQADFPADVRKYSDYLTVLRKTYRLVGATLYRPGHYTSIIKSNEHGLLYYDGLVGRLQNFRPSLASAYKPSHLMYVCST